MGLRPRYSLDIDQFFLIVFASWDCLLRLSSTGELPGVSPNNPQLLLIGQFVFGLSEIFSSYLRKHRKTTAFWKDFCFFYLTLQLSTSEHSCSESVFGKQRLAFGDF